MRIRLTSPEDGAVCSLLTGAQRAFAAQEERRSTVNGDLTYRWDDLHVEGSDDSVPEPVRLSWTPALDAGTLIVEEDGAVVRREAVRGGEARVWNLKTGTRYRWCVESAGERSEWRSFGTADEAPRWILLEGNSNVRDLGGWRTVEGRRIKQGLIYRCGEFDTHMNLAPEGARRLTEELGIRTDLELRGADGQGNVLTETEMRSENGRPVLDRYGIEWIYLPVRPYDTIFTPGLLRDNYARCFEVLADETKYPLCFHCWGGADRGGTLALLAQAVLGVSRDDLILDYEYTTLSIWGVRTRNYEPFANMMRGLEACGAPDAPFSEKVSAFLRSIGVKQATLDRLRRNLLV